MSAACHTEAKNTIPIHFYDLLEDKREQRAPVDEHRLPRYNLPCITTTSSNDYFKATSSVTNMKFSIAITIFAAAASASASILRYVDPTCYRISNFGSEVHHCSTCRDGYNFISRDKFCDIGFECCEGICCRDDDDEFVLVKNNRGASC
ncbi:hypothetical protein HGRIS_014429 [Hohenbuehelia grisea]|uniref:Uncharacterized protein n=1 Tax=Hohenbuehelia grisea TaxID=104357 RepID=A0ABR3JTN0_9AGAR